MEINKLNLVWDEHQEFMSKTFKTQRDAEQYCDISIVSSDGFVVRGHQAILAAASGWFMKVLDDHRHDHPTVVLQNVPLNHLKAILNYIYMGSIQVEQSVMNELLEIADKLELKGLSQIRKISAMNKFLAHSEEAGDKSTVPKSDNVLSRHLPDNFEDKNTPNEMHENEENPCSAGLLFEDTPEAPEEPIEEPDKIPNPSSLPSNSQHTMQYSGIERDAESSSNLQGNFLPCSGTGLNTAQLPVDHGSLQHTGPVYASPSSICFSQSHASSYNTNRTATSVMQQHQQYSQTPAPSQIYNNAISTCSSKRDFESRIASRGSLMLDYSNHHSIHHQHQQPLDDFRLQNHSNKMSAAKSNNDVQQNILYQPPVDSNQQQHLTASNLQQCVQQQQPSQQRHQFPPQYIQHSSTSQVFSSADCSGPSASLLGMPSAYSPYECSASGSVAPSVPSSSADLLTQSSLRNASCYQTAGIDLSLTKSEPSSPKDCPGANGSLSGKRKRDANCVLRSNEENDSVANVDGEKRENNEGNNKKMRGDTSQLHSLPQAVNDEGQQDYARVSWLPSQNSISTSSATTPSSLSSSLGSNSLPVSSKSHNMQVHHYNNTSQGNDLTPASTSSDGKTFPFISNSNARLNSANSEPEDEEVDSNELSPGVIDELNNSNSNDVDILSGSADCMPDLSKESFSNASTSNATKCRFTIEELAIQDSSAKADDDNVEVDGPDGQVLISVVKDVAEVPRVVHRKLQINAQKDENGCSAKEAKQLASEDNCSEENKSSMALQNTNDGSRKISKFASRIVDRRLRRQARLKRLEARKKWLAQEKKALFSGIDCNRPLTRALQKLYSIQASKNNEMDSKNCDADCDSLNVDTIDCVNVSVTDNDCQETETGDCHGNSTKNIDVGSNSDVVGCETSFPPLVDDSINKGNISLCLDGDSMLQGSTSVSKNNSSKECPRQSDNRNMRKKVPLLSPMSLFTLPPLKNKEKQSRTTLSLQEKVKVIESFLDGKSHRQIALMYGIGKTQVSVIIKRREEILSLYKNNIIRGDKLTGKRVRKSEYALLNEHLIKWYQHMAAGTRITTGMLRAKALQIAPQLGFHDFKASNGWFATFKSNNNLKFARAKSKSDEKDNNDASMNDGTSGQEDGYFDDADVETNATEEEENGHQLLDSGGEGGEIVNSVPGGIVSTPIRAVGGPSAHPGVVPGPESSTGPCAGGFLASPGLLQGAAAAILKCGVSVAGQTAAPNLTPQLPMEAFHLSRPMDHNSGAHHPHHHPAHHHTGSSLALAAKTEQSSAAAAAAAAAGVLGYKSEEPLGYGGYDHHHQLGPRMTADQLPPRMSDQLPGRMAAADPASRMADQLPHRMADPSRMAAADQLAPRMAADQLSGRGMPGEQLTGRMGEVAGGSSSSVATAAVASSSAAAAAVAAAARTSEYNYAPYTFPSGYYGYHFLGQY